MPIDYGDQNPLSASTMRGQDWPCLRQFCIFLENKVGLLNDILRHLERHDLKIMALSNSDMVDCAIARIIMSEYDRSRELLELSNFTYFETDIIGVELPDEDQPLVHICSSLIRAEVNINYTYPLLYRRAGRSAIAIYTDEIDEGIKALRDRGLKIITENDLLDDDDFM